ncbi:hypothetical protein H5410_020999 [Solanum commersonii]|uniref:DUF4283 domain-containing protein n=1 Tax=Solanum commersonii TaxID=4109 RepID=A0A9J5ZFV9_SOLCO|nr:hypothetical protein H5410_020999 [Solanum commersonii]
MGVMSFAITASFSGTDTWFDWVERSRLSVRRMSISRGVLLWLCKRMQETSGNEGKIFKSWKCRDMATNIYCTQKFNKYGEEAPTRNNVGKWAVQTWKGVANIQSRRAAEHILMGEWKRQDQILKLDWWHPTKGVFPDTTKFDWYWIRVLGLPLHLWNSETMRKIGDKCGGWLENEEETELKNHLRWARIRVKGPREKIPPSIEVEDENLVFSMPSYRDIHQKGREDTERYISDIDVYKKGVSFADTRHVSTVGTFSRERLKFVGGPSSSREQLEKGVWEEREKTPSVYLSGGPDGGKPIPFKSNKQKDKIDPKELGPEQKQKLFTEPFVELISMSNSETCRCSNFVEFKGEGELDVTGVTRMEKREKEQDNQLQSHARIQEKRGSIRQNNPTQINGEGEMDFSNSLYTEPEPLQVDNSTHEEDLAANATEWVQANMIKLGQQFGVVFKGCKKEAYTMLARLDQRREKETGKG